MDFADKGLYSQRIGFSSSHVWMREGDHKEGWAPKNWCFRTVALEKTLESHLDSRRSSQSVLKEINLNIHWKAWCWSWSSSTLATWCEELTHWKRPWGWERLKAGGEGDDRGWDGWMASPTQWTWVGANSRGWWRTGRPGVLQSMGSQKVRHDWATEQQQQELYSCYGWNICMKCIYVYTYMYIHTQKNIKYIFGFFYWFIC